MDVVSDEELQQSSETPFILKDGNREYTVVTKKKPLCRTASPKLLLLFSFIAAFLFVSVAFSAGLLVGYVAFGTQESSSTTSYYRDSICSNPPVLLISLDGFRAEYLDRGLTPNIMSLVDEGVRAEYMAPSFPSKTFPNHFTLVTGLFPEQHGIIDNYFYDSILKESFFMSSPTALDPKWWLGEPIWVTAHNAVLKTAVYFWPGSEVPINGILPDVYFKYNKSTPFELRTSTILGWFDLPDRIRPQFMAGYFEEPDSSGHEGGPDSTLVNNALVRVDNVIGSFISGLKDRGLYNCVNLVIVSDHGMTSTASGKVISLVPDLLPMKYYEQLEFFSYGIFCNLFVNQSEMIGEIYNILRENIHTTNAPVDIYLKGDAPPEYNIGEANPQRYGDIFLVAKIGSYIKYKSDNPKSISIGQHGYNNTEEDMRTIFIGHGPSFKSGTVLKPFENIEVYNLLCELLDIIPSDNNGTTGALDAALIPCTRD